ncbi:hypothetical protein FQZ33_25090, partial [Escherichia coli]|uniref:hypothetical protein n=1 Tax=Escherichia coli TaxID=562 RepID=UPI00137067F9
MLQAALNQSARLHFGAKGCYLDWPAGTDAGDSYELEGPVESDQNGVLWRWEGAAMLPMVADQSTASDELTNHWQAVTA